MSQANNSKDTPSVLLVSIDALKPEFVFEQERLNVKLPNITKYFLEEGLSAPNGMKSVFPTFTYPCHQSMITGTNPRTHKISNNSIFDPVNKHMGAWYWFANTEVKTLWEAARENGYLSASVAFPTSVGAKGDFIAPEFWWDGSSLDSQFINAVAKPQGIILEMEKDIGRYPGGRNKIAPLISEKPFFLSAYFASFDESAHVHGVYSREATESLEKIDRMLGELIETAQDITRQRLIVCVVSDHGTMDNAYNIFPNVLLREAGLIDTDPQGNVVSWKAFSHRAGGTAEIRLADPGDTESASALKDVLKNLKEKKNSGILDILTGDEARQRGGFPDADYVLVSDKGYEFRDDATGEYCRTQLTQKAQHGYDENFPEMRASFMMTGEGIPHGTIDNVRLIDVAPTLACLMNVPLPDAEGQALLK